MKRFFLILVAIIVLVPLAVVAWLALFFDANDYREQIADGFKSATGREITIEGDLETSFFPWIGIQTGVIEVANAPGFGDTPLAGIKAVKVKLKLMPLFSGQVEMETVVLGGVQANLVTLANGKTNWDFNLGEAAASSDGSIDDSADKPSSDNPGKALAALAIGGIEMRNAKITWDDRQGGTKLELSKMNLETGSISFDSPIPVSFNTDFAMNGNEMTGQIKLSNDLIISDDMQKISLKDFNIAVDATGTALQGGKLEKSMNADITVDLVTQQISSDKVSLELNLSGDIAPVNPMKVTLESPLKVDLKTLAVNFPAMQYSVPGSNGTGSMLVSNLDNPMPTIKLIIETERFDASPWAGSTPTLSYFRELQVEQLLSSIVNIHLAHAQQPDSGSTATTAESTESLDLPVETIRQLDIDASLSIGTFILDTLEATDVKAELKAKNGIVDINPFSAKVFGGTSTGTLQLNATGNTPKFHVTEVMSGVQIAQVVAYSMGEGSKEWVTGIANMDTNLTTQGNDIATLKRALNGTVNTKIKDGTLTGFSIRKLLQQANALLKGKSYVDDGNPDKTKILELALNTKLVNGVAISDDIKVLTPLADLTGAGSANLNTEQLDYRLKMTLSSEMSDADKAEFKKLEGKSLPFKVAGSFDNPKFKIDMDKAAKQEVKQKAEKKLRKKYGKKYGKELDMLFGR